MHWNWKVSFKKNFFKILLHEAVEIVWLGSWVIGLNNSLEGWIIGVIGSIVIHMLVFHGIDFLHEHHHHHQSECGHEDHKDINYKDK
jgi:steroid 5-alpha reductase family enzyme